MNPLYSDAFGLTNYGIFDNMTPSLGVLILLCIVVIAIYLFVFHE